MKKRYVDPEDLGKGYIDPKDSDVVMRKYEKPRFRIIKPVQVETTTTSTSASSKRIKIPEEDD